MFYCEKLKMYGINGEKMCATAIAKGCEACKQCKRAQKIPRELLKEVRSKILRPKERTVVEKEDRYFERFKENYNILGVFAPDPKIIF